MGGLSQRIVAKGRHRAALVGTNKCRKSGLSACRKGKEQKGHPSPDTFECEVELGANEY